MAQDMNDVLADLLEDALAEETMPIVHLRQPDDPSLPAWRNTLGCILPSWDRRLSSQALRNPASHLEDSEWVELQARVEARLAESRADSTWATIASVVNQFTSFDMAQTRRPGWDRHSLDSKIIYFLEHKAMKGLRLSSVGLCWKKLCQLHRIVDPAAFDALCAKKNGVNTRVVERQKLPKPGIEPGFSG